MRFLPPSPTIRWLILAGIAFALVFGATVLSYNRNSQTRRPASPTSRSAEPTAPLVLHPAGGNDITWSQDAVNTPFIFPGDRLSKSVVFVSSRRLENVTVEAVPEIARFVAINPETLSALSAGTQQTVVIAFLVPSGTTFGTYDGTIHIRDGTRTLPDILRVTIKVGLPPDPGEAGNTALEGIDSDGDGVRDDVQRYIGFSYPDSAKTRAALVQFAKTAQASLLASGDKSASIAEAQKQLYANDCLYYIRPGDAKRSGDLLLSEVFNTEARIRAYLTFNEQVGGQFFPGTPRAERKSRCDFDSDALEN